MKPVSLQFYGSLNDLLPATQRHTEIRHELIQPRSVKDLIESVGVPHTEIGLIIVNGKSVDFSHPVKEAEQISIYPALFSPAITPLKPEQQLCQPQIIQPPRFVLDVHLGKLARQLRMLGFDSVYQNNYKDPALADISSRQKRVLLTCDRQLLMRNQVIYGYLVRARQTQQQLAEILSRFNLYNQIKPFTRCMHCNNTIQPVEKQAITSQLPADTIKYYDEFFQCTACSKIYWKGSHYLKMKEKIENIKILRQNTEQSTTCH